MAKFNKLEKQWILYDVANSAYTLLATALLAFYFDFLSPSESLTTVWGSVNTIVTIIAVILCPIMGIKGYYLQAVLSWIIECIYIVIVYISGKWIPKPLRPMILGKKTSELSE